VRDGAVDLVLDPRVDLEAEAAVLLHQPEAHVVVQALGSEVAEQLAGAEMRPRLLRGAPVAAPVARRAGGRDPVDDSKALGGSEQAAAERSDERRIQQHDAAEELGPAHRGEVVQVAAERMAHAMNRRDFLDVFDELIDEAGPSFGWRIKWIHADGIDPRDLVGERERMQKRGVARSGEAVRVREVKPRPRRILSPRCRRRPAGRRGGPG
jgi:hypothetical protein